MDLLEGSRSLMEGEGERELLFCFGRARMSRRKKISVREEEDGYKYPLSPNGHLSRGSAAPVKTARVRSVKFRLSWL